MGKSAGEHNEIFHEELEDKFDRLEDYEEIEDRLGYYSSEKQITDDAIKIKDAVLEIYSSNEKVDWKLIKPLKTKLNRLIKNLEYFEKSLDNKQKVSTSRIQETRKLIEDIGELKTANNTRLKQHYSNDGFDQMKRNSVNLLKSMMSETTDLLANMWDGDEDVNLAKEKENFCKECENYINDNITIFNNLKTKKQRLDFVIAGILEVSENVAGPKKFRLLLGRKFNILDDLEDYGKTFYEIIDDYGLKDDVTDYLKKYVA